VRTRTRMEAQRDEAQEAQGHAEAERDDALRRLAELRAHLDEALLANRELQQRLHEQLAAGQTDPDGVEKDRRRSPPPGRIDPSEEPIGTRAIPAARAVSPHLHRAQRARDVGASAFDVWAIRVLGTAAAICFILLLVMFLRLFL
jgi:chromosome segregation ATPase